jgi:ABC-type transport system involved in cytochrome bd biosynthesis fused ATPase/permease subunit
VILLSLKSPWLFLTIGIAIIVINLGILKVYINADRELFSFRMQYLATLSKTFEEVINGIDLFRAYQQLHLLQKDIIRDVYRYNVQLTNYRFITQGMTILCEISGLCILAAAAFFAIKLKVSTKPENLAIVGTSISFCLRMTTIVANIVRDSTRLDNQLKICVVIVN